MFAFKYDFFILKCFQILSSGLRVHVEEVDASCGFCYRDRADYRFCVGVVWAGFKFDCQVPFSLFDVS